MKPVLPSLVAVLTLACTSQYVRPIKPTDVSSNPELITRGNYLVNAIAACGACHTPRVGGTWLGSERIDAFLSGGSVFDSPHIGLRIVSPNITQDRETGIGNWTDDEIARAIRDGIHRDNRFLFPPMPFGGFAALSDDDTAAIVAYLRTVAPVRNPIDRSKNIFPFTMRMAVRMGALHHPPVKGVKAPEPSDKIAHGAYLAKIGVCWNCHSLTKTGPSNDFLMAGSKIALADREYGKVWARNLTPNKETGLGRHGATAIKEALKAGRRLDGKPMAPPMSLIAARLSRWTDEDLDALVAYLKSLPAIKHAVPPRELTSNAKKLIGVK